MLTKQQAEKLDKLGLSEYQKMQVISKAGGIEKGKSVGGFLGNVAKSGGRYIGGAVMGLVNVANPDVSQNTLTNLADLILDTGAYLGTAAVDKPLRAWAKKKGISDRQYDAMVENVRLNNPVSKAMGMNQSNKLADMGNYYYDRYSNPTETLYNDPVGVLGDVSALAQGVGGLTSKVGTLAKSSNVARAGNAISRAGQTVEPINLATRGINKLADVATPKIDTKSVAKTLNKKAENLATRGIGNPAQQADFKKKFGMTPAQLIEKYDLWDRDPELAATLQGQVGENYSKLVTSSTKQTDLNKILQSIDNEIATIRSKPTGSFDNAKINALNEQRLAIMAQYGKSKKLSGQNLLDYRQMLDRDINQSAFDPAKKVSGQQAALKSTRDVFKSNIDNLNPQVAQLGREYGALGEIKDILSKSQSRGSNRQLVNFTKFGGAGLGGIAAGAPGAIAGFATEQIANSPQFIKSASQGLKSAANTVSRLKLSTPQVKLPSTVSKISPYSNIITQTNKESKKKTDAFYPASKKQKINVPRY